MLVINRKVSEGVVVNGNVEVTVVRVLGDRVVLGFTAPRDVPIDRREIHYRKQKQREGGLGKAS